MLLTVRSQWRWAMWIEQLSNVPPHLKSNIKYYYECECTDFRNSIVIYMRTWIHVFVGSGWVWWVCSQRHVAHVRLQWWSESWCICRITCIRRRTSTICLHINFLPFLVDILFNARRGALRSKRWNRQNYFEHSIVRAWMWAHECMSLCHRDPSRLRHAFQFYYCLSIIVQYCLSAAAAVCFVETTFGCRPAYEEHRHRGEFVGRQRCELQP